MVIIDNNMIYNIVTFKDGTKQKYNGDLLESQIRELLKDRSDEILGVDRLAVIENLLESNIGYRYLVRYGYGDEMTISIEEKDLEKAVYAWMSQRKVNLTDALLDGKYIISITEDFHSPMGWNKSHKLEDEDWNQLRKSGVLDYYKDKINSAKQNVQDLISTGNINLIGKDRQKQLK